MTDRDESLYWYLRLPDDIALGMVNTIAAGRGDTKPRYTRHSHELTMNGYRADVDLAMKFLAKAGYAVVERAALRALVDAALDTMATGIESAALDAAVLPFLSESSRRASAAPAATEEEAEMIPEVATFTVRHCSRALAGDLCDDRDAWTCDLDLPGHLPNRRSTSGPTPTEAVEAMVAWLLTEPPVRRTDLPTVDDLVGIEPDLTEGLASEEWVRRRRDG